MMTVAQVSKRTGVSVRTLHHYDQIGLLKPTEVTDAGYRLYDDATLDKLYIGKLIYDAKNKSVSQRDVENIVSGHFLRFGGYGERNGYSPTSTKLYSVILYGTREKRIETRGFHL